MASRTSPSWPQGFSKGYVVLCIYSDTRDHADYPPYTEVLGTFASEDEAYTAGIRWQIEQMEEICGDEASELRETASDQSLSLEEIFKSNSSCIHENQFLWDRDTARVFLVEENKIWPKQNVDRKALLEGLQAPVDRKTLLKGLPAPGEEDSEEDEEDSEDESGDDDDRGEGEEVDGDGEDDEVCEISRGDRASQGSSGAGVAGKRQRL